MYHGRALLTEVSEPWLPSRWVARKNKMAHPTSSLLASYRNAADCAGQHRKIGQSQGGVAAALMDHTNQYGPSHAAFSQWKRSGIPTAEVRSRVNALRL